MGSAVGGEGGFVAMKFILATRETDGRMRKLVTAVYFSSDYSPAYQ